MSIPKYHEIMYPMLEAMKDQQVHTLRELESTLASHFKLTHDEIKQLLPSGKSGIFYNRVGWARTYLKKAGLIDYLERGKFKITERGLNELKLNKEKKLTEHKLRKYDSFKEFFPKKTSKSKSIIDQNETPDELIENHFEKLKESLKAELLKNIASNDPIFFENLVIDLILSLGYGGNEKDARRTLTTNDEGIDGIINEDKLGLDIIYIQAKRWNKETSIGRPEIQKFAGALQGKRARKGIFITSAKFSQTAFDYVKNIDSKIILIDGDKLTDLMIENNLGVQIKETYHIKEVDTDYFVED